MSASRAVLSAIARAVEQQGDIEIAHAELAGIDPLLRGRARRRLREAYADAAIAAPEARGDAGHVMRLAYLDVAGRAPALEARGDVDAVAAAYAEARASGPRPPSRFWWATTISVLAAALSIGGAVYGARWLARPARTPDATERAAPPPSGAFANGGKPAAGTAAVERAFETDLPAYMVALDRWAAARREGATPSELTATESRLEEARRLALSPDMKRGLGDAAVAKLEVLLGAARAAAGAPAGATETAGDAMMEAVGALDDELAATGLGYYVDGDVIEDRSNGRRVTMLYFFAVERVTLFDAGGARVRGLELRRKDHLNWTHTLLGFTRPHLRDAVVLLDQVDDQLATYILPGLGEGASVELFDEDPALGVPTSADAVRARAGELVRAEYRATPGLDGAAASRMGTLLARRRALFDGWQKVAATRGVSIQAPSKLRIELDYASALAGLVPAAELAELTNIDDGLADAASATVYAALREVLVASIQRHEVQHRVDLAREGDRTMPDALERYVGAAYEDGKPRRLALTARDELSAYLGELARDERTTRVNLGMIARFLFKRRMWGTAECYAALVVFEALRAELPRSPPGAGDSLLSRGEIDREAAARIYLALTELPGAELRSAAQRVWERLFGGELLELRRRSE